MDFDKVISDIYPWILNMARKYCRSRQDAEDLAGETVFKMLANRDKFDSSKPIKPWCVAVMKNTFITLYNRNSLVYFIGYDPMNECCSTFNSYDMVMFHDLVSVLHRCLHKTCCMECVMYYAKGYSYDEISVLLGIPIGTVRSRIFFGRKIIRQEIS